MVEDVERLLPPPGGHPDAFYEALLGLLDLPFVARWALEAAGVD